MILKVSLAFLTVRIDEKKIDLFRSCAIIEDPRDTLKTLFDSVL
jgi:hypothetical protein